VVPAIREDDSVLSVPVWRYLPVFQRLALALAPGLLIGMERERHNKEAGLGTFTFATLVETAGSCREPRRASDLFSRRVAA
jgi:hypothetical protein